MAVTPSELVKRIEAAAADPTDDRGVRGRVLGILDRVVPFDSHLWLLTDPDTLVGTSPLAEVPRLEDLPTLVRLEYQAPGGWRLGVPLSWDPPPSPWRDLLAGYGVRDVASLVFTDRFGCWGFLDVWRDRAFTTRELDLLAAVVPVVTGILRQREALALATPQERTAATARAVLVLAPTLEVLAGTPPGDDVLGQLLPTAAHRELVPAGAYHVAAQLLAVEAGADDHPASARVHVGGGRWLTFRAARQAGSGGGEHDIAVTVEPTTSRQRLPLFARAHGLSARETDVLVRLAEGEDTGTVAARLFVSEYAVLDHLKSISAKTGLRSRHALLTAALG